jgi:SAM-dependent methyltransferase
MYPALDSKSLAIRHASVYDGLAEEYGARATALEQVTDDSIARMLTFVGSGGRALDVGAGAGLVAQALTRAGYDTTAIDVSPRMAAVCRTRVPQAHVVVGDYLEEQFDEKFDAIVAFAFIHLFPTDLAVACLRKMRDDLTDQGALLIGTTAEPTCSEGFEGKLDYPGAPVRYRRRWRETAFLHTLRSVGLRPIDVCRHRDPFGKTWADVLAVPDTCRPRRTSGAWSAVSCR